MATKSILKVVDIKDKHFGRTFVSAIENAKKKGSKEIIFNKSIKNITKDKIKSLFGE